MSSHGHDQAGQGVGFSSSFTPSSWSSSLGVSDVLASYRRSQYIITGQNVASSLSVDEGPDTIDEEAQYGDEEVIQESDEEGLPTPVPPSRDEDSDLDQLGWENEPETVQPASPPSPRLSELSVPPGLGRLPPQIRLPTERSPLLHKVTRKSSSRVQLPQTLHHEVELDSAQQQAQGDTLAVPGAQKVRLVRRKSSISARSEKLIPLGRSTFGQTLFNSIAILLGFGMLAEPLAFAYAGWIGGTFLIIFYGTITCYTAKILARIMAVDPQIRTYADIGSKAFGPRSRFLTSSLFCLELFSVSVVLVTLFGDSLHSILPNYSSNTYKLIGLIILVPSVFCPLAFLSYTSILGILSTLLIIAVLFVDGYSKPEAPGSLWSPAPTSLTIAGWGELGVAFGLFMAGFSGHAVLPSLARDMANPQDFDKMINMAFITATVLYAAIGGCGYLMFGNSVSDEVSRDMLATPGYNVFLNKLAVWSLVIMPLTKFALTTRPVNVTLEILLGLEANNVVQLHDPEGPAESTTTIQTKQSRYVKDLLIIVERTLFTCLSVAISTCIPEFSSMMAFVGSFSAFMLCVIGPVAAKVSLAEKCGWTDGALLLIATIMATWGTFAAFAAA